MYPKRKTYRKTTAKPKTYNNGYVKTSKSLTAYLQGYKLILTRYEEVAAGTRCYFKVTKNSKIVGSATGTYSAQNNVILIKWKNQSYFLTPFKK
jgi:hypothetical protein